MIKTVTAAGTVMCAILALVRPSATAPGLPAPAAFELPSLSGRTIAPARVTEITRAIVRQYFDQELLGRRSTLLAGTSVFPEVTATKFPPPAR